jgi:hypothetical protein
VKRVLRTCLVFLPAFFLLGAGVKSGSVMPKQPSIAYGGRAVAIAIDPADESNIVVASESGGLFKSTTHGAKWTQVSGSSTFWFTDVAHLPANSNIVIATAYSDTRVISGGGIWRSIDGGASWTHVSVSPPTQDCHDHFAAYGLAAETGRSRVWAGTLCGVAYSDDQGATWAFLPVVSGYNNDPALAVLAPSTGRVVISTYDGVKITTDDGATWKVSTSGLPLFAWDLPGLHNQIAAAPGHPDHLYWALNYFQNGPHIALFRSLDNGGSWSLILDSPGINRKPFVRTSEALSGDSTQYDVYFGNGGCLLQRATAFGSDAIIPSWTVLSVDHCDAADIGFSTDHKTPILLATDGGLHDTSDGGLNWTLVGGGKAGYNALQIYQVTGQVHGDGVSADLYMGTQDNAIWASPDEGASWPAVFDSEGFYLDIPRDFYPASETRITGRYCVPCAEFISGPLLAGVAGFPDAPDSVRAPRLLQPGYYLQETETQNVDDSFFALTTNTGGSWATRYSFPEEVWSRPEVADLASDPVVYTAVREPGTNPDGSPVVKIKRVSGVLGNQTPLVSDVSGFGSLGAHGIYTMENVSFGVDPRDSNLLIVSDIVDNQVKISRDAGATWTADTTLTDLVTESGQLKFSWWPSVTQTSAFAFDPECDGHILVGTQQAGVFETFDRGGSWLKIINSEQIPDVTSIFFPHNGRLVISSFGRGLWSYGYACPSRALTPPKLVEFAEPLIFWKGARIPISQIHDPEACPACGYFLAIGGRVLDYKTEGNGELLQVIVEKGAAIRGYTWDGHELAAPFERIEGRGKDATGSDGLPKELRDGKHDVRGLFVEGRTLRGLIVAPGELTVAQLPRTVPLAPHIRLSARGARPIDEDEPIVVTGVGFLPGVPVEVLLDGQPAPLEQPADFDPQGNLTLSLRPRPVLGPHVILVRQSTAAGLIEDAGAFAITVSESE